MSKAYKFNQGSLIKILLHSAKFPSSSANGLLLGRATGIAPGSPRPSGQESNIEVLDTIPLFHTFLTLAPSLEVALCEVRK